jgi:integrase
MGILQWWRGPRTQDILEEMLLELSDLRRSERHTSGLKNSGGRFAERFPYIRAVRDIHIVEYLREQKVGPRRRDNILANLKQLLRYAARRGYIKSSPAREIPRINEPSDAPAVWTPEEAELLLESVSPWWIPCEAIGLFAGLRRSEIFRLDWSAFNFDLGVIAVVRRIAKKSKVDRLVPLQPNLMAWLKPFVASAGLLYRGEFKTVENQHSAELCRIRAAIGLPRKDNANRHSYGSYRLAVLKSYDQVALEMGNSPAKVRENYNNPKAQSEGERYFSIIPGSGKRAGTKRSGAGMHQIGSGISTRSQTKG